MSINKIPLYGKLNEYIYDSIQNGNLILVQGSHDNKTILHLLKTDGFLYWRKDKYIWLQHLARYGEKLCFIHVKDLNFSKLTLSPASLMKHT